VPAADIEQPSCSRRQSDLTSDLFHAQAGRLAVLYRLRPHQVEATLSIGKIIADGCAGS
jgi:hypothetical protein